MKFLKSNWPILLILAISAFTRLYRISDYMEFLGDQGRDVVIVRDFLRHGNLFFIGPQTSIGNMYLGPFYYYLFMAPGLLLTWFNPVGPAIVVALFGILTVLLIFKISLLWFNPKTAYTAAILFALSPVVIKYSSFSWNPNIMPFFALLFIYFVVKQKYTLASLAFIICLNSHFLALLLLPVAAIIFLTKRPLMLKSLLIPTLIFCLSLVPQILFDIKHQGQNISAFSTFFLKRETTVNLKPYKALPQIGPLFNQLNTRLLASKNTNVGYFVTAIFILMILLDSYQQIIKRKFNYRVLVLYLWLFTGLVGLALYKQHIYDHYFGFLYPVVFILFAYYISRLPNLLYLPVLSILVLFALRENPFRYSPPAQMKTTSSITQLISDNSDGQPFNFALLAKMNYDPGYRYFFAQSNAPVKLLQDQITTQLFVVCEPFQIDCNPINNPEWSIAAFGWAKIDQEWEINGIKIFKLISNPQGKNI